MNQFFEAFANMFRIPACEAALNLRLAMLAVYRLGAFLPTPGINTDVLAQFFIQTRARFWESSTCSAAAISAA